MTEPEFVSWSVIGFSMTPSAGLASWLDGSWMRSSCSASEKFITNMKNVIN
jgi:hypothetical protein